MKAQRLAKFHRNRPHFKEVMVKFCQYRENGHGNQALIYFSDWFVDLLTIEDVWGQNSA